MSGRQTLEVVPVPLDLAYGDPRENLRRVDQALEEGLRGAAPEQRLFLFPELTLTGFVTENPPELSLDGPEVRALAGLAAGRRTAVAAGFPERNPAAPGRPYNALVLFDPQGRLVGHYRKLHLFTLGRKPESSVYSAGEGGVVCEYRGWRLGLSVCFDLRFPALFQLYAREKVDAILLPACWVDGPHKTRQFEALSAAQAILTQAYFVSVNRRGSDSEFRYDGRAYVHTPMGEQVFDGRPVELRPEKLEEGRRLSVRPSDRAAYRLLERTAS